MRADAHFLTEIDESVEPQRACVRDEDCTLWTPVLSCGSDFQVLNCARAVRSDAVPSLELARERVQTEACAMLDPACGGIGVSCPPTRAVCAQSLCTATQEQEPAPCSVEATSAALAGARIRIEADGCRFRPGEGGQFRYRVELPSALMYQLEASTSCGLCATDLGDVRSLVVARVGTGQTQYCPTCDVGCCAPNQAAAWTLGARSYDAVLDWPGRTWNGPSDTGAPLGGEFTQGSYDVDVTLTVPGVGTLTAHLPIVVQ